MKQTIINYWRGLEKREQLILSFGCLAVGLILFYAFVWQPWHTAISNMEKGIQSRREALTWMRQTSDMVKNGGVVSAAETVKDANQSLLSVVTKTARESNVNSYIQQMDPGNNTQSNAEQVNVVLEEADFNQWVLWVDELSREYSINITQLTVDKETDDPNIVELRVTFERG